MPTTYLFRVDMAKDNDEFFAAMRSSVAYVYAGVDLRFGASAWVPDLVRVVVEEPPVRCCLTLIELEAIESVALISCRKFLPEKSTEILLSFDDYLDRIIRQCRSTADPRESEFLRLKGILSEAQEVAVTTAGALRSPTRFVEELPLIDQPNFVCQPRPVVEDEEYVQRNFHGDLRLSQHDAAALGRCVMILDAVIRNRDHSSATLHTWRGQDRSQPLKRLLKENTECFPALRSFVVKTDNRGMSLNFEILLSELVQIWSEACKQSLDREHTRSLVSGYFSVAVGIKGHDKMELIFEVARKHLRDDAMFARIAAMVSNPSEPTSKAS